MLATNAGLLTPILGDPSPWNPERLYINGEAGVFYDPGDLTAEKVAWRRNLLTWSEQFDNAAWTKLASTITANADVAPDGTTTADKIVETATTASHGIFQNVTVMAGAPYTFSVYAKAAERGFCQVRYENSGSTQAFSANVNLSTGTFTTTSFGTPTGTAVVVTNVGSGWYRIALTANAGDTTFRCAVFLQAVQGTNSYAGDGTSGALAWGCMLNPGTVAESYQRITDFTSDFLAAFPTHALYQDAAGTTPVTALGQPVGLALDKSRGALANAPELLATGVIALDGTATAATYNTTTGVGTASRVDVANQSTVQFQGLSNSALTRFRITNTGLNQIAIRTAPSGTVLYTINAGQTLEAYFQPAANRLVIAANSSGTTVNFTVVSVREVPGVHAIQTTSASRPALDARVNLLTFTEQFDNAAWTKDRVTATANTAVAPDGTTTADTITANADAGFHYVKRNNVTTGAASYTAYWHVKKGTSTWLFFTVNDAQVNYFNIDTGQFGTTDNTCTATSLSNGWWLIAVTRTQAAGAQANCGVGVANANGGGNFTATGTESVIVWGADLRLATDAAYPYQRVVTATDYADVGVPRSFLFDGFDDSLYTASTLDLSGTDKVTVWAGVYKNSDATLGILLENTATSANNVGVFAVIAPTASSQNFLFRSMGSLGAGGTTDAQFTLAAPVSRVVTGIGDISGDLTALRLNGAQVATNTGDQGTGNYANAVLFIGRRNNTNLPFNGKLYIPVVRGAQTDAATLALTDRYVGSRMGIVL
jgi:hypothetical protein